MTPPPEPAPASASRSGRSLHGRPWYRSRAATLALSVLAVVCSMGLVVVSPLALPALDGNGEDWERIGEVPPANWTAGVYAAGTRFCLSKDLVSRGVTYP